MKILITGADGFIGRHLARELILHEVVRLDRRDGDLLEPGVARDLIGKHQPEVVVHLAAQVGRLFGEDDVLHTIRTNAGMTALVAKATTDANARLVYASTSEVYGDQGDEWLHDRYHLSDPGGSADVSGFDTIGSDLELPHNLYGLSKAWGEQVADLYAGPATHLRLSMPFGPGLPAGRGRAAIINFLWNAHHGLPITVHRASERCWCWVGDTVRGIRMIIESGETGPFNVGRSDNQTTMEDVALEACVITGGSPDLIELIDAPENQTTVKRLSNDRLQSLGWVPAVDLGKGMKLTYEAMRLATVHA